MKAGVRHPLPGPEQLFLTGPVWKLPSEGRLPGFRPRGAGGMDPLRALLVLIFRDCEKGERDAVVFIIKDVDGASN